MPHQTWFRSTTFLAMAPWALLSRLTLEPASRPAGQPPRSGVIVQVRHIVKDGREVPGSEQVEKVTFRGPDTRRDESRADRPAVVTVKASRSWSHSAGWDRFTEFTPPRRLSYPEEVRQTYRRMFSARKPQRTTWNGRACWKYSWHQEAVTLGDVGAGPYDVTYWVLADPDFPLIVRSETSYGSRMETRDLRLNIPVPDSAFERPASLKPFAPFKMPPDAFEVNVQRKRVSHRYGWTNTAREDLSGNGDAGSRRYSSVHSESSGRTSSFTAPVQSLDSQAARIEMQRLFQLHGGREIRREKVLGLEASVLVLKRTPEETLTSWVVDHPDFGTICVKTLGESADETETMEVVRIRIDSKKQPRE